MSDPQVIPAELKTPGILAVERINAMKERGKELLVDVRKMDPTERKIVIGFLGKLFTDAS